MNDLERLRRKLGLTPGELQVIIGRGTGTILHLPAANYSPKLIYIKRLWKYDQRNGKKLNFDDIMSFRDGE